MNNDFLSKEKTVTLPVGLWGFVVLSLKFCIEDMDRNSQESNFRLGLSMTLSEVESQITDEGDPKKVIKFEPGG